MESQNPWWYNEIDTKYEEWKTSLIKWIPPILKKFNFKPFSLNFLVGPRQVGKTTALKIFIHEYLLKKFDSKSIFYLSCEELIDFKELGEIIDNYISFRDASGIKSSFIILDEITFVVEWYRAIKARIDRGIFKNDILIISGSASLELLKQKEYFPGRRGYGLDLNFYPLSFSEYLSCIKGLETFKSSLESIDLAMKTNKIHNELIVKLFENYLNTGGFPLSIIEFFSKGRVSYETMKIYIDWLRNDFRKLNRSEAYMKEILSYIIKAQATPISWLSISKGTSIASPHTVQAYLEDLKNLFVIEILNLISPDSRILYRKNKKIHFIDPFLYRVICEFTRCDYYRPAVIEGIVASHISRRYNTYYWRNKSEVDIIVKIDGEQIGIEVKSKAGSWIKPRHLNKVILLEEKEIPLFLCSINLD